MDYKLNLRTGELVEVRSKAEILATLDKTGRLEDLPFMPEMFHYCGKRFAVYKRAHKTCDTVNKPAGLRMNNAVHLSAVRCNGLAHGGCQAECLIFWKEAWLKRVDQILTSGDTGRVQEVECSERAVIAATMASDEQGDGDPIYKCQATELPLATKPLSPWDLRQYVEDYTSGNTGSGQLFRGFVYAAYFNTINLGIGAGAIMRWIYDRFQALWGGIPYPRRWGTIPVSEPTPSATLDLKPGELVRVKAYDEILKTVNTSNKNRGLYFDAEMVPYCGGTYRVLKRVTRIINEKTGKMMTFKNDCIMLDGVVCHARYSNDRFFCPRAIYSFWREIWLERVPAVVTPRANSNATEN